MKTPATLLLAVLVLCLLPTSRAQPAGPTTHHTFQGEINGVPTQVLVATELLPRLVVTPGTQNIWVGTAGQYFLLAGQVVNDYAAYAFTADIANGLNGYGDMVDLVTGDRLRIRIDLFTQGFVLSTNPFEGGCGEFGCAHYPFVISVP
jgi:hypothetical protein